MDAVLLARIQFAFTVGYHFLFVPISLGSSVFMLLAARRWYKSQLEEDKSGFLFWLKIFTATFVIGVATGITMEFAFGTNWATYSRFVGDIFGAPLAAEALFAFFLESTFLGVLLFGRNRVKPKFYYVSVWLVVCGALLSALWIIIANSWQQTPGRICGRRRQSRADRLLGCRLQSLDYSALPAYRLLDLGRRLAPRGCFGRLLPAQGASHRPSPRGPWSRRWSSDSSAPSPCRSSATGRPGSWPSTSRPRWRPSRASSRTRRTRASPCSASSTKTSRPFTANWPCRAC